MVAGRQEREKEARDLHPTIPFEGMPPITKYLPLGSTS
jgi:hypothetical protein